MPSASRAPTCRLALLGAGADGDLDLAGGARPLDLLGRLGAVAAVGREQRAGPA